MAFKSNRTAAKLVLALASVCAFLGVAIYAGFVSPTFFLGVGANNGTYFGLLSVVFFVIGFIMLAWQS
jgi:hypothetical protein